MSYRNLVEDALKQAKKVKLISEGVKYPDDITERMHPQLESDMKERKHSLGEHPAFPDGDECSFEEKILGERFGEVVRRYKRVYDTDTVNKDDIYTIMKPIKDVMGIEYDNRKELEELAIKMVREEYDVSEDVVEINAELTAHMDMEGTQRNQQPIALEEFEFDSHDHMVSAKDEVYKRRFINAMIQGSAKKCNHMFHMVDEELSKIDPRLPNRYSKIMATADLTYYAIKLENEINGGVVKVEFPSKENPKAVINAKAMIFPVLVHEIVKGVMEILSANGLPKNKKLAKYVMGKADYLAAEPWDMRLGPALWERFCDAIDVDDFPLKHHIYAELVSLPVKEFNHQMKEILAGTKQGKKIVKNIADEVRKDMQEDEMNEALNNNSNDDDDFGSSFNLDELKPYL